MLQEIGPRKFDNAYRPKAAASDMSPVFCFREGAVLIRKEDSTLPFASMFENTRYAFAIDGTSFFLSGEEPRAFSDYEFVSVRRMRESKSFPQDFMFAVYTALHLDRWYRSARFCGRCGRKMRHSDTERAMLCDCGQIVYPRLNPAVICAVESNGRLLVTQYNRPGCTFYALVAGFVEIGETLEEACRREVMEETGLEIKNLRYYKSQPWGTAGDILAGFWAEVDGSDVIRLDESELKVAKWAAPSEVVLQPDDYSLTNEMMRNFKENH